MRIQFVECVASNVGPLVDEKNLPSGVGESLGDYAPGKTSTDDKDINVHSIST